MSHWIKSEWFRTSVAALLAGMIGAAGTAIANHATWVRQHERTIRDGYQQAKLDLVDRTARTGLRHLFLRQFDLRMKLAKERYLEAFVDSVRRPPTSDEIVATTTMLQRRYPYEYAKSLESIDFQHEFSSTLILDQVYFGEPVRAAASEVSTAFSDSVLYAALLSVKSSLPGSRPLSAIDDLATLDMWSTRDQALLQTLLTAMAVEVRPQ